MMRFGMEPPPRFITAAIIVLRVVLVLGFLGDGVEAGEGEARGRVEAFRVGRRGGRLEVGGRAVEVHVVAGLVVDELRAGRALALAGLAGLARRDAAGGGRGRRERQRRAGVIVGRRAGSASPKIRYCASVSAAPSSSEPLAAASGWVDLDRVADAVRRLQMAAGRPWIP